jgi:hypothetical protein
MADCWDPRGATPSVPGKRIAGKRMAEGGRSRSRGRLRSRWQGLLQRDKRVLRQHLCRFEANVPACGAIGMAPAAFADVPATLLLNRPCSWTSPSIRYPSTPVDAPDRKPASSALRCMRVDAGGGERGGPSSFDGDAPGRTQIRARAHAGRSNRSIRLTLSPVRDAHGNFPMAVGARVRLCKSLRIEAVNCTTSGPRSGR